MRKTVVGQFGPLPALVYLLAAAAVVVHAAAGADVGSAAGNSPTAGGDVRRRRPGWLPRGTRPSCAG